MTSSLMLLMRYIFWKRLLRLISRVTEQFSPIFIGDLKPIIQDTAYLKHEVSVNTWAETVFLHIPADFPSEKSSPPPSISAAHLLLLLTNQHISYKASSLSRAFLLLVVASVPSNVLLSKMTKCLQFSFSPAGLVKCFPRPLCSFISSGCWCRRQTYCNISELI